MKRRVLESLCNVGRDNGRFACINAAVNNRWKNMSEEEAAPWHQIADAKNRNMIAAVRNMSAKEKLQAAATIQARILQNINIMRMMLS